jgi:hypothetical protein
MGLCKVIFLQMYPYLVSHIKLVCYSVLIMALLVSIIGSMQNLMDLLANVLNLSDSCLRLMDSWYGF